MAATEQILVVSRPKPAAAPRRAGGAVPLAFQRGARVGARAALISLMVAGTLSLFTVVPAAWLWLGSQIADSYIFPAGYIYVLLGIGIPASMAAGGKLLCCAGALHERLRGTTVRSVPDAWRRSRSEVQRSAAPVTALDVVATAVAAAAVIGLVVYLSLELSGVTG